MLFYPRLDSRPSAILKVKVIIKDGIYQSTDKLLNGEEETMSGIYTTSCCQ